ncbi:Nup133 N terminal like-domain-containing protein [Coniella lustricola]|uniref:Nup133 N terminal like-domain-containing protein n=1 Tax=Coniella lustricola TaxID=2025994 RepID=A0A2T3AHF0_9PEZI|nr:Nup133 N terminal like-domain-containing protein [Coniella lustricola]
MATRSRRRQRNPTADNTLAQQPKPKRQRVPSAESASTVAAATTTEAQNAQPEMLEVKHDKVARLPSKPDGVESSAHASKTFRRDVPVRSKKPKQGERTSKSDGSVELTKTSAFTVSKLQALPDRIRAEATARQHGALDASNGYALCLTHTHAFVWQYAAASPSPETFTFTLPYPSKHASDPLPLGALVSPGTSNEEPGLVIVMPSSGKVTFWEHISSAATLDYFTQQRTGVEETIPGMFGGEQVVQITKADSVGFILAFSSGRLAHLGVRDGQGKPAISLQFLRTSWGQSSGVFDSFLGGIKHAIKSAVQRGDLAAVRVDSTTKTGPNSVVAVTKNGRLQAWRVQRGGHHEIIASVDTRELILHECQQYFPNAASGTDFEVLDLAHVPRNIEDRYIEASRLSDALYKDDDSIQHLLLLVSLSNKRQSQYSLVEIEVQADTAKVGMIRAIDSYTTPVNPSATSRPRIYLPRPALVAFIIFDRAVIVASLAALPETPDMQLQEENHVIPPTFEDVVDLRSEDSLEIVGTGLEEPLSLIQETEASRSHRSRPKNPTALLMIREIGVIKVALPEIDRFAGEDPPEVTARDKLEQAVFYGLKDDNPLAFEGRRSPQFSDDEIAQAAVKLSDEILASKPAALSSGSASIETNLRQRSAWLDKLMSHLNAQKIKIDRRTRWYLLSNAEKLNTAREIWKLHETFLRDRPSHEKKTVISEAIESIHEQNKKTPDRTVGELDATRTWFLHDTAGMDMFLPWNFQVIKQLTKHSLADEAATTRLIYEAIHVYYEALHGAREYRVRKLDFYGLGSETVEFGILPAADDYEGLPKFWTSSELICEYFHRLIELCLVWLDADHPTSDGSLIKSIRDTLPKLLDQLLITLHEYIRWSEGNGDESVDHRGNSFSEKCRSVVGGMTDQLLKLADYGLGDQALAIAEKYNINKAMAELVVAQMLDLREQMTKSRDADQLQDSMEAKKLQLIEYMDRFGASFAFEAYKLLLTRAGPQEVLSFSSLDKQGFGTIYLRNDPRLGKVSWINDVEQENDLKNAAKTLLDVGEKEEQVWSKKIELSLGKLTLLAEGAGAEPDEASAEGRSKAAKSDAALARIEKRLEVVRIQDQTYQLLCPAFEDAVDDVAAIELAMQAFAPKVPKKHKVVLEDLQDAMGYLVSHKAMTSLMLINLLTLIRLDAVEGQETNVFSWAIRVADLSLHGQEKQRAMRLIWRRCYNRDDWSKVNHTENMDDQTVMDILKQTQAYCTMVACIRWRMHNSLVESSGLQSRANHSAVPDMSAMSKDHSHIVTPQEAQGVFTNAPEEWFGSESDDPALLEKRAEAMRWEDASLVKFIDRNQLIKWAGSALEAADRTVRFSKTDASTNGANGKLTNGHNAANGHAVKSSNDEEEEEMDDIS